MVRIVAHVVELLRRPLAEAERKEVADAGGRSVLDHPRLGGTGVEVRVGYARVVLQRRARRRLRGRIVHSAGIADRPTVRGEIPDVEEIRRADGAMRIGQIPVPRGRHVPLPAGDHEGAFRADLPGAVGAEDVHQAASRHGRRPLHARRLQEGRREVHEVHHVVGHPAGPDRPRQPRGERHFAADVVEVALRPRYARDAVVAADHHQRVVELARLLQHADQRAESGIDRHALAQVVADVLAHLGNVGQERRKPAGQSVGVDAPQRLAGPLPPLAVGVGRPPPVAERLLGIPVRQKAPEVAPHLVAQPPLGRLHAAGLIGPFGSPERELVEVVAAVLVAGLRAAVRIVLRRSR